MNAPSTVADLPAASFGLRSAILDVLEKEAAPLDGISLDYDPKLSLLWITIDPDRHCISKGFVTAMQRLIKAIKVNFGGPRPTKTQPIKYAAYRSVNPDVFLYGADFDVFLESIRSGDPGPLRDYAHRCIDLCYENHVLLGGSIPTIAVVRGATYGGGFEAAASCNIVVADRTAQFQLPEMRFSSFPGLAYSIIGRRAPLGALHEMVMASAIWSAEAAKAYGVVDVLAPSDPIKAAEAYIASVLSRHEAHCGALRAMNAVKNVTRQELQATIEEWIDCTMAMPRQSVHFIAKLREAQGLPGAPTLALVSH